MKIDERILMTRRGDWETVAHEMTTMNVENRDINEWCYSVAAQARARADECQALMKVLTDD